MLARANAELGHIDPDKEEMIEKKEACEMQNEVRNIMEVDWDAKKAQVKQDWINVIRKQIMESKRTPGGIIGVGKDVMPGKQAVSMNTVLGAGMRKKIDVTGRAMAAKKKKKKASSNHNSEELNLKKEEKKKKKEEKEKEKERKR